MTHHCHALGCARTVPPKLLFCAPHWRTVPINLQRLIWATYVPGQEARKDPTAVYLAAQTYVVNFVASREGKLSAREAVDRTLGAFRIQLERGDLSVEDVAVLARYEPTVFKGALDLMKEILRQRAVR